MSVEENLELMKTLDDAWNAQDWDVFRKRHASDTAVYWPGQPEPTRGRDNHHAESVEFFKMVENSLENNPYKVMFGQGDWTCTIASWKGKMIGPMTIDGKTISSTGKTFELEFCTIARWKDGEIVEEKPGGLPQANWRHVAGGTPARAESAIKPAGMFFTGDTYD